MWLTVPPIQGAPGKPLLEKLAFPCPFFSHVRITCERYENASGRSNEASMTFPPPPFLPFSPARSLGTVNRPCVCSHPKRELGAKVNEREKERDPWAGPLGDTPTHDEVCN